MVEGDATNFDLEVVRENFKLAIVDDDDVNLDYYLKSFAELSKFFCLLGTIFGYVEKELTSKMNILREFLEKPDEAHHFVTVKNMVNYERDHNLLTKQNYISGSRTLLRLHRSLEFIQRFLESIQELRDDDGTHTACIKAYEDTLGNHHSFFIRTGAKVAMYTLPVKHKLLSQVCGSEENIRRAEEILPDTLTVSSNVYNRVHKIYKDLDLLSLP